MKKNLWCFTLSKSNVKKKISDAFNYWFNKKTDQNIKYLLFDIFVLWSFRFCLVFSHDVMFLNIRSCVCVWHTVSVLVHTCDSHIFLHLFCWYCCYSVRSVTAEIDGAGLYTHLLEKYLCECWCFWQLFYTIIFNWIFESEFCIYFVLNIFSAFLIQFRTICKRFQSGSCLQSATLKQQTFGDQHTIVVCGNYKENATDVWLHKHRSFRKKRLNNLNCKTFILCIVISEQKSACKSTKNPHQRLSI